MIHIHKHIHILKGIPSFRCDNKNITYLNVKNINQVLFRKRWFALFDNDYKYEIIIKYNIKNNNIFIPFFNKFIEIKKDNLFICRRYKTKNNVINEINDIYFKKKL